MVKKVRCKIGQMIDEHMATDKVVYPSPLHEVAKAFYSSGVDIDEGFGAISVLSKLGYLDCEVVKEEPVVINIDCALSKKRSNMAPRYWVFACYRYYPTGGMHDRIGAFADEKKAIEYAKVARDEGYDDAEVWDIYEDKCVFRELEKVYS